MRPPALVGLGLALASGLTCSPELTLPSGVEVACGPERPCPEGLVCSTRVSRCVPSAGGDDEPPGIVAGSLRIDPEVVGPRTTLEVGFDATEALALAPEVHLELGATRVPLIGG